jgi:hypothetical protein
MFADTTHAVQVSPSLLQAEQERGHSLGGVEFGQNMFFLFLLFRLFS